MLEVILDMETGDPDDVIALMLLVGHPRVHLKAVTLHPGTPRQIGLVRNIFAQLGHDQVPIGYSNIHHKRDVVSRFYDKHFTIVPTSEGAQPAAQLILNLTSSGTTIITVGALTNVAAAICLSREVNISFSPMRLVIQGGFASSQLYSDFVTNNAHCNLQPLMDKFYEMETCPSFNLGGDIAAVDEVLKCNHIRKYFVSKNVCHAVTYTSTLSVAIETQASSMQHMQMIHNLLSKYRHEQSVCKALHDPFAVICALSIDDSTSTVVSWLDNVIITHRREAKRGICWRAEKAVSPTNTSISIALPEMMWRRNLFE